MADRIVLNTISYHGHGAIENIVPELTARGYKKAFVCSDPDLIKFGVTKKVTDLLDAQTNRGYGNSFFPIKRKWIISNDSQGIFVPIVTKNFFLKYYTKKGNNLMVWDKTDAEDYITAMEQALNEYLKQE